MRETHKLKLRIEAVLSVPHDPEHPELTQTVPDMIAAMVGPPNRNGYAVCSGNPKKYTADLRITGVEVVEPCCPLCKHVLGKPI